MTRELLLALDLGTSSTRALVVDAGGAVLGRAARPLSTRTPAPDRVEQDPEQLFERSVDALRAALDAAGAVARDVAGLGIATQRATAIAWDAQTGRPLAPAVVWQDRRTAPRVAELRARGIPITTLPSATKLEWLVQHDAAVRDAARSGRLGLGTPDAWLGFRLSGGDAHVTDPGQASCTGLFDPVAGAWSPSALSLFGLDAAWLPEIVCSAAALGETPATLLGGPVAVAARAGDQQAASFAQGVRSPGDAKLTLGTAAMLEVHTGTAPAQPPRGAYPVALWRLPESPVAMGLEGSVITAGATLDWLVALGILPDAAAADAVAGSVPSTEGVTFVPALEGLGTPILDDAARGLVVGLHRGSTGAHLVRAALEGIAHRCVDLCEAFDLDTRPLPVDGGLARSRLCVQWLADLSGRPLLRAREVETTALGAAALAGLAAGVLPCEEACAALRPSAERVEPAGSTAWRREARRRFAAAVVRARP